MNRTRILIFCTGLFLVTVLLTGCSGNANGNNNESDQSERKEEAVPVEVAEVSRGRIEGIVKSSADLEAERSIPVFARTVNRVQEIFAEEGDYVEKGQVLLVLDDDIQQSTVGRAEAQMLKAQQEYNRIKSLYDQSLESEQNFQNAELDLKQLKLAYEEARRELDYTTVEAPISGTISARNIQVGDFIGSRRDESALLFDIVDFDSIVAYIYLPEKHLPELKLNQVARVYSPSLGEEPVEGYVLRIAPVIDPATGTVKVTIAFKDTSRLRPGMYVNVELVTYVNPDAVLVPKQAIVYDADQTFVFRLIPGLEPPDRKVERVLLVPKLQDRLFIEPVSSIDAGDQLVIAGKTGLKDQGLVRLPGDPKPEMEDEDGEDSETSKE